MKKTLVLFMLVLSIWLLAYDFEHEYSYYEDYQETENPAWGNEESHRVWRFYKGAYGIHKPYAFSRNVVLSCNSQELSPGNTYYDTAYLKINWGDGNGWSNQHEFSLNQTRLFNHD